MNCALTIKSSAKHHRWLCHAHAAALPLAAVYHVVLRTCCVVIFCHGVCVYLGPQHPGDQLAHVRCAAADGVLQPVHTLRQPGHICAARGGPSHLAQQAGQLQVTPTP